MPYSKLSELPATVKKLPKSDQRQWMAVWNSAFSACTKNGGKKADCEQSAFAQAWGVVGKKKKSRSDDYPDGELCPYQDCCHDLAFDKEGWWKCEACGRPFRAYSSDSDYSDWVLYKPDHVKEPVPDDMPTAKDLGASWATPGEDEKTMSKLQRFIARLLKRREIKDVESWDGSASNYSDTEKYCAACLIDVNSAAGRDTKAQSHCMLPVKDTSGAYVRQAIHAAVGGHGITQVKRPDDVPQEDWDKAVMAAAKTLEDLYDEMGEELPESVMEEEGEAEEEERATNISDVYDAIWKAAAAQMGEYAWLQNLYYEGNQMFAIIANDGKLYRANVVIGDGEAVSLGEPVEVKIDFPQVSQSRSTVRRQADGRYRWVSISCSAVLNRVGEIDSRALFDSFIAKAEETGDYPIRQFYHAGAHFRTGQADFLGRDGYLLVTSGVYDDTEIARREIEARQKEPGYWGDSIGFVCSEPSLVDIGGVKIPAYESGVLREISTLPETEAASWLTATPLILEVNRMLSENQFKAFVKLFDGDDAAARKWLEENSDPRNRQIDETGMIARSADKPEEPAAPATPVYEKPEVVSVTELPKEQPTEFEFVLEEKDFSDLADKVRSALFPDLDALRQELKSAVEAVKATAEKNEKSLAEIEQRVKAVETDEEEKREIWQQDAPKVRVRQLYRPREQSTKPEAESGKPENFGEVAEATLSRFPTRY